MLLWPLSMLGQDQNADSVESRNLVYGAGISISDNIGIIGTVQHKDVGSLIFKAGIMGKPRLRPFSNYLRNWLMTNYRITYQTPLLVNTFYGGLGYTIVRVRDNSTSYINSLYWESYSRKEQVHSTFHAPELDFGIQLGEIDEMLRMGVRINYILNPEEVRNGLPLRNDELRRIHGLGRIYYNNPNNFVWGIYLDYMIKL